MSEHTTDAAYFAKLCEKIAAFGVDARLMAKIEAAVHDHELVIQKEQRRACYLDVLRTCTGTSPELVGLLQLHKARTLHYGPQEWVPAWFENHERMGLVHCAFNGGYGIYRAQSRTLTMTADGDALCREILAKRAMPVGA